MVSEENSCIIKHSKNEFKTAVFVENNEELRTEKIRPNRVRVLVNNQFEQQENPVMEDDQITELNTSRIEQMQLQAAESPKHKRFENGCE